MPSLPVSRGRALVLAGGLLLLLVVAGRTFAGANESAARPAAALVREQTAVAATKVVVHVTGAVAQPGLYRLKEAGPDGAAAAKPADGKG